MQVLLSKLARVSFPEVLVPAENKFKMTRVGRESLCMRAECRGRAQARSVLLPTLGPGHLSLTLEIGRQI